MKSTTKGGNCAQFLSLASAFFQPTDLLPYPQRLGASCLSEPSPTLATKNGAA